jgi:1-acyl-sn-glycerol-3-phosphate acyltransferase
MRGTGLLASQLRIPVVPVRIDGLFELKQQGRRFFSPPGSVSVAFGAAVIFAPDEEPAKITADLERRVEGMSGKG